MVEDHPFNYRDFEGVIPEGNYGAGTVIVWDEGTYHPIEEFKTKKEQEKHLLRQLKAGSLKIVLQGKKLKGEWALVRTRQAENSWLLIKHKDKYASSKDITTKEKSVQSGKTLNQVEKALTGKKAVTTTTNQGGIKKPTAKKTTPKKSIAKKTGSLTGKKKVLT